MRQGRSQSVGATGEECFAFGSGPWRKAESSFLSGLDVRLVPKADGSRLRFNGELKSPQSFGIASQTDAQLAAQMMREKLEKC